MMMVASGCLGGISGNAGQATTAEQLTPVPTTQQATPTSTSTTDNDKPTVILATTTGSSSNESESDGPQTTVPRKPIPISDEQTKEIISTIREKQSAIDSYRATVTETTVQQLSNGSEQTRTRKADVAVKYGDAVTMFRYEPLGSGPEVGSFRVQNATASVSYEPSENEYRVRRGPGDHGPRFPQEVARERRPDESGGANEYSILGYPSFETVQKENVITHQGNDTVNGEEVYVIHFEGNGMAYYAEQTFWIDKETGVILKRRALKPRLDSMGNISVSEAQNPEEGNRDDATDGPNAVYLGDKTHTWTYSNVSINDVSNETFQVEFPTDADIEVSTPEGS
jgi:outer membrane lipoprotein-sorting protein